MNPVLRNIRALVRLWLQALLFVVWAGSGIVIGQGRAGTIAVRDVSVRFEHLTVADGLSQTTIYSIYQDRHGFMWFATQDGLNRYDGYSMKVYRHVPFDSTAIGDNTVVSITEDRDGYLWVGSGRGLHRMDPATETFTAFRNVPGDSRSIGSDEVRNVLEDRGRRLWVSTSQGLDRYDRKTGEFVHYRHVPGDPASLSPGGASWIYEDLSGALWIGTRSGLDRMRVDSTGFDHFLSSTSENVDISPADYDIQRFLERSEEPGILWVGTAHGLVRLNPATGETTRLLPSLDPTLQKVSDLVQDPIATNVLWLPVPGAGLTRFDMRTDRFSIYGPDPADPQSLSTTNTERVFVDRSGMLWVGANGTGVDRFNPATVGMSHFSHDPGKPGSLPGSHVRGIYQDGEGGLWVGTTDVRGVSRLSRFDPTDRVFRNFEHRPTDPASLGEGRIRAVLVDHSGAVWVGVAGSGLDRMPPGELGRFQHFRYDADRPTGLSNSIVRYLLEDHSGTIWVATNGGLDRLISAKDGTFQHYRHDPDDDKTLTGDRTSVLYESRAGFIWVGADGGLNRLDPLTGMVDRYMHDEADRSSLASDAVLAINERSKEPGIIWVGAFGGGLNRLDVSTGRFKHYTEEDGLPNNTVYGILEDEQGRLWMSTNVGLARLDPETGAVRSYGLDVGLQSLEFNSVASDKGPFGEMFFGGVNGFNAFFPDELTENLYPPEVTIMDVKIAHQSVSERSDLSRLPAVPTLKKIRLRYDQADVTFDFVALHFQNPKRNRYSYRLEGYNDDWVDAGSRRTASYTNLAPGAYTFRVKAANSDGVWNDEGASLEVVIEPPWWRTWWALTLYVALLLGALVTIHRVQSQRAVRAERERSRQREVDDARTIEAAYHNLRATQEQLIQAEKLASLGHLTAGIAHEIKNPLNFVNNFTDLNIDAIDDLAEELAKHREAMPAEFADDFEMLLKTVRSNTERVRDHGRRADGVVKNMLRHSQSSKSERHPADLNALLREYASLVQRSYESKYPEMVVAVEGSYDADLGRLEVVPQDVGRVFMNLLNNAFESLHDRMAKGSGAFEPQVTLSTKRHEHFVEIRVGDNGIGVAPSIRDKIFNPFFTTREVGEGAGLGLSMSYEILAAHGGSLELENETGEGASFVIRLPN